MAPSSAMQQYLWCAECWGRHREALWPTWIFLVGLLVSFLELLSTRGSPPALIAYEAINVLCVIVPHGFGYRAIDSLESEGTVCDDLVRLPTRNRDIHSSIGLPRA